MTVEGVRSVGRGCLGESGGDADQRRYPTGPAGQDYQDEAQATALVFPHFGGWAQLLEELILSLIHI